jgi:hypothetical protein
MTRQQTLPDVTEQRTLTDSIDDCDTSDSEPTTQAALLDRARTHADVAREHFPEFPVEAIDWEVSERAQRQAGVTEYDPDTEAVSIRLTWDAYREFGWEQFSATVRHELIHAWQYHEFGQADHGTSMRTLANDRRPVSVLQSGSLDAGRAAVRACNRARIAADRTRRPLAPRLDEWLTAFLAGTADD